MPGLTRLALYVAAALLLTITPGLGILYVAARTLADGRAEGVASSFGAGLGGMIHVFAGTQRRQERLDRHSVSQPS